MNRFLFILLLLYSGRLIADEGMWLLPLIQELNITQLKQKGFQLEAEDIYSVNNASMKDAVVLFNGNCTGELISKDGLLMTNHHCGFDNIRALSSVDNNILRDGFWAKNRLGELPCPGLTVDFLVRMNDVTLEIENKIKNDTLNVPFKTKLSKAKSDIELTAVKGTNYHAKIVSFFSKNNYYLVITETFSDVRLVGTPHESIAKFGGEIDNWNWPRHNADFALFRVYAGKNNKPADYDISNVPYQPKHFFPISLKPLQEGDFSMTLGYPFYTYRFFTSYKINDILQIQNKVFIDVFSEQLSVLKPRMAADDAINIKYSSDYASVSNHYLNAMGENKIIMQQKIVQKMQEEESQFELWAQSGDSSRRKYAQVIQQMRDSYDGKYDLGSMYISVAIFSSIKLLDHFVYDVFNAIYDMLEKPVGTEKDEMIKDIYTQAHKFYKDYDQETEILLTEKMIQLLKDKMKPEDLPEFFSQIDKKHKGSINKYVQALYNKSFFRDSSAFFSFMEKASIKKLEQDAFWLFFKSNFRKYKYFKDMNVQHIQIIEENEKLFIDGMRLFKPQRVMYPDANATMRMSYGNVMGFYPRDAVHYDWKTSHYGYLEKYEKNNEYYDLPLEYLNTLERKDFGSYAINDTLPVCFISTNDITGGNSGSPVIDARGAIIGLAFDGHKEGLSGDFYYNANSQRTLNVDVRYILYMVDHYYKASYLLQEMKLLY